MATCKGVEVSRPRLHDPQPFVIRGHVECERARVDGSKAPRSEDAAAPSHASTQSRLLTRDSLGTRQAHTGRSLGCERISHVLRLGGMWSIIGMFATHDIIVARICCHSISL